MLWHREVSSHYRPVVYFAQMFLNFSGLVETFLPVTLVSHPHVTNLSSPVSLSLSISLQIENLLEQLKDKDRQLAGLRERVQGLQTDSSNTDTALTTLEEALSEKVKDRGRD